MKNGLILVVTGIGVLAATQLHGAFQPIGAAQAECEAGTHLDKTTIDDIRAKLIQAGFKNPAHLRKGCDNAWHGTAMKDGHEINVAVTPDGHIIEEGD